MTVRTCKTLVLELDQVKELTVTVPVDDSNARYVLIQLITEVTMRDTESYTLEIALISALFVVNAFHRRAT